MAIEVVYAQQGFLDRARSALAVFNGFTFDSSQRTGGCPAPFRLLRTDRALSGVEHSFRTPEGLQLAREALGAVEEIVKKGALLDHSQLRDLLPLSTVLKTTMMGDGYDMPSVVDAASIAMGQNFIATAIVRLELIPPMSAMIEVAAADGTRAAAYNLDRFIGIAGELISPNGRLRENFSYVESTGEAIVYGFPNFKSVCEASAGSQDLEAFHKQLREVGVEYNSQKATAIFNVVHNLGESSEGLLSTDPVQTATNFRREALKAFYQDGDIDKGLSIVAFFQELEKIRFMEQVIFRAQKYRVGTGGEQGYEVMCLGRGIVSMKYDAVINSASEVILEEGPMVADEKLNRSRRPSHYGMPERGLRQIFGRFQQRLTTELERPDVTSGEIKDSLVNELVEAKEGIEKFEDRHSFFPVVNGLVTS